MCYGYCMGMDTLVVDSVKMPVLYWFQVLLLQCRQPVAPVGETTCQDVCQVWLNPAWPQPLLQECHKRGDGLLQHSPSIRSNHWSLSLFSLVQVCRMLDLSQRVVVRNRPLLLPFACPLWWRSHLLRVFPAIARHSSQLRRPVWWMSMSRAR